MAHRLHFRRATFNFLECSSSTKTQEDLSEMAKLFRTTAFGSWFLGLLTLLFALAWRLAPHRGLNLNAEARSMLLLAAVFFLSAIASAAMGRTASA